MTTDRADTRPMCVIVPLDAPSGVGPRTLALERAVAASAETSPYKPGYRPRGPAKVARAPHIQGLVGSRLPSIVLQSFAGRPVDLCDLAAGWLVIYCYPGDRETSSQLEDAREHRAYHRHEEVFQLRGIRVAAVSTQSLAEQFRAVRAHDIRHTMLLDPLMVLAECLGLPIIETSEGRCYARTTLLVRQEIIEHVFYPVARGAANPEQILAWIDIHGW